MHTGKLVKYLGGGVVSNNSAEPLRYRSAQAARVESVDLPDSAEGHEGGVIADDMTRRRGCVSVTVVTILSALDVCAAPTYQVANGLAKKKKRVA